MDTNPTCPTCGGSIERLSASYGFVALIPTQGTRLVEPGEQMPPEATDITPSGQTRQQAIPCGHTLTEQQVSSLTWSAPA